MKFQPPFKLAIASLFLQDAPLSSDGVMEKLQQDYAGSKMLTCQHVEFALQSLKAVGILKTSENDGSIFYCLTNHGRCKVSKSLAI